MWSNLIIIIESDWEIILCYNFICLRSIWDLFKCQETSSSALLIWRLAARASRQADGTQTYDSGHSARRAPGGRVGSARLNDGIETLMVRWRLAAWDRCTGRWGCDAPGGSACDCQAMTVQWWFCRHVAPGGVWCPPSGLKLNSA